MGLTLFFFCIVGVCFSMKGGKALFNKTTFFDEPRDLYSLPLFKKRRVLEVNNGHVHLIIETLEKHNQFLLDKESMILDQEASESSNTQNGTDCVQTIVEGLEDVTAVERETIGQRIRENLAMFEMYEKSQKRNKLEAIFEVLPHISDEEALKALEICNGDEEESIEKLTDYFTLSRYRVEIAQLKSNFKPKPIPIVQKEDNLDSDSYSEESESDSERMYRNELKKKKKGRKDMDKNRRLRLKEKFDGDTMQGWSKARMDAWKSKDTNPNTYYYRFNDPGEEQKHGKWSDEEKKLFMKRMEEMGECGQWGIFSMAIPGRVGYQCANFYRQLVANKEIEGNRYLLDENGKYKANSDKENKKKLKKRNGLKNLSTEIKIKSKRRKNDDDDDDEFKVPLSIQEKIEKNTEMMQIAELQLNPLPGFMDVITNEEVIKPAMAPSGRVLSYSTWIKVLTREPKDTCPFTKAKLTKRDLILLTIDNIDQYRDIII